jgi:endonuclease-3
MKRLNEYGLTVDNILKTDEDKLKSMIFEANFNATKAKNIKKAAQIIKE